MKRKNRIRLALWVAVAGLPLLGASGFAQVRMDTSHASDANNRVGSGGSNDPVVTPTSNMINGDAIANGYVTGGAAFRGRVPFNDPAAFHGPVAGLGIDTFVRDSYGVGSSSHPGTPLYEGPKPFYPVSITATPPDGFVSTPGYAGSAGNFVPTPTLTAQPEDQRLGMTSDVATTPLPMPGELLVSSQVDPNAPTSPTTYYAASPLYGVREWQSGNPTGNPLTGANPNNPNNPNTPPVPGSEQDRILQMRRDLIQSSQPDQQTTSPGQNNPNQPSKGVGGGPLQPLMAGGTTTNNNQPLQPLQPSGTAALTPVSISPVAGQMSVLPNPADLALPTPAEQSLQYAEMQRRLADYNRTHPQSEDDRTRQFLSGLQSRRLTEPNPETPGATDLNPQGNPGSSQDTNPTATPGASGTEGAVTPSTPLTPTATPAATPPAPAPLEVSSLAEGVKSPALANLLADAEDKIQHQQYSKAIETYDEASAVAPNNPLIPIGRANAELGGSYYQQAAADLRGAFKQDSAVMMAQYDLAKILGDQRLKFIVTDLKQIASDSPQNPTPVFLLAYIAYNTHHEDRAAGWLDVADKRSGGTDDVIPLLKKYWTFNPSTQPSSK